MIWSNFFRGIFCSGLMALFILAPLVVVTAGTPPPLPDETAPPSGGDTTPPPVVPAPNIAFITSAQNLTQGQSAILSWASQNANSCQASGAWTGSQSTGGLITVTPTQSSTYTLSCAGAGGTTSQSLTISVTANQQAANLPSGPAQKPTLIFNSDFKTITAGQAATLIWLSQNATSCQATGSWSGSRPVGGSEQVSPPANAIYTLVCVGPGGAVTVDVPIIVTATLTPSSSFTPPAPPDDSSNIPAPNPRPQTPSSSEPVTLWQVNGDGSIYLITQGKRLKITSADAFGAAGFQWSDVQQIEASQLMALPRLKLARAIGDARVYYLTETGHKHLILNERVFLSYGSHWADVAEVPGALLEFYPDIKFIKLQGSSKIYFIQGQTKRLMASAKALQRYGYQPGDAAPVNAIEFRAYKTGKVIK